MISRLEQALYRYSKRKSRSHLYPRLMDAIAQYRLGPEHLVLNIGAGGEVAQVLAQAGLRMLSVDSDPARGPDLIASVEDLAALASASCDAAVCAEVLEHVRRPEQAVEEILRVLKPGGVFIGSSPFLLGVHDAPEDYRRFTVHGLRQLLCDFTEVSVQERNTYFSAVAVLISRRFAIGSSRERRTAALLSPMLLPLCMIMEALDRMLPCSDGSTGYVFVARKPAP